MMKDQQAQDKIKRGDVDETVSASDLLEYIMQSDDKQADDVQFALTMLSIKAKAENK